MPRSIRYSPNDRSTFFSLRPYLGDMCVFACIEVKLMRIRNKLRGKWKLIRVQPRRGHIRGNKFLTAPGELRFTSWRAIFTQIHADASFVYAGKRNVIDSNANSLFRDDINIVPLLHRAFTFTRVRDICSF